MTTLPTTDERRTDVADLLRDASTASLLAAGTPFFVAEGDPPTALWANEAALTLFGVADLAGLTSRVFGGNEPGSRRLVGLARGLPPGVPPRLERLRFFIGRRSEALTIQCRRTADPEPLFAIALLDARPALLRREPPKSVPLVSPVVPEPGVEPEATPEVPAEPSPVAVATEAEGPAPRRDAEAVQADLRSRFDGARSVRFLWQTDADLVFVSITGALCDVVGCAMSDLVGHSFAEVARRLGLDAQGLLATSLGRRETWSGVEVAWPVAGADALVPVTLGALPAFDRDRNFEGFRGFGVIHVQRVIAQEVLDTLEPPAAEVPVSEPEPESSVVPEEPMAEAPTAEAAEQGPIVESVADSTIEAEPAPSIEEPLDDAPVAAPPTDAIEPVQAAPEEVAPEEAPAPIEPVPEIEAERSRGQNVVPLRPNQGLGRAIVAVGPRLVDRDATPPVPERAEPTPSAQTPSPSSRPSLSERLSEVVLTPHVRDGAELSSSEQLAFREIARALGARIREGSPAAVVPVMTEPQPVAETPTWQSATEEAGAVADGSEPLLERLALGILVSRDGEALFANRHLLDRLGYPSTKAFAAAGAAKSLSLKEAADPVPHALRAASGDAVILEGQTQAVDWRGAPALLTTFGPRISPDLSGRVGALEQEIRQRESETRELHAILDTATDGVVVLDESGSILSLNHAGQALFGFDQGEVAGEPFTLLFAKESHAVAMDYLDRLKANGVASVLNDGREAVGRARQGGAIPLFMTMGRVGAAQKPRFCAVLRDMTAWKKAERELNDARRDAERASALKSDFLAKISHEIRTPLNAILGFAEVIMEERFGPVGNDRYKDYLKDIHSSGTHVMSLVNDLLDLSKIEAGKLELNFGAVDANKIVSECVSLIQPQANQERVIVRLSIAPQLPDVVADERSLRQIVLNILSNAVKFNVPGGQVIVSTALTDAGHAVIRIRDTGIGMSESDVETALEPFRQIATSRNTAGTGLGLPLTKALVEANRASFTIKSKKKEGTLVEVAFPSARVLAG